MPGTDARRAVALIASLILLAAAPAARAATGAVDLVSRAAGSSAGGNSASQLPVASADGNVVAFLSRASNLTADAVPGGNTYEAFVRKVSQGTTVLASQGGSGASSQGVSDVGVSDDGRYVVFATGQAGTLGAAGVYLRDTQEGTTTLVAAGGVRPAISADASTVAYGAQSGGSQKVFAYDVADHQAAVVSIALNGLPMTGDNPSLSANGRIVAFSGQGGTSQVWVRDRDANTTTLASRASGADGAQASTAAIEPDISGNGRFVVFRSAAPNLSDDDAQNTDDIFERDLVANTTTLVSRADGATGAAADN